MTIVQKIENLRKDIMALETELTKNVVNLKLHLKTTWRVMANLIPKNKCRNSYYPNMEQKN